jgi:hypothetical protein
VNPKDKAAEILNRHKLCVRAGDYPFQYFEAVTKRHATESVNIILSLIDDKFQGFMDADLIAYWEQVKNEINKP